MKQSQADIYNEIYAIELEQENLRKQQEASLSRASYISSLVPDDLVE